MTQERNIYQAKEVKPKVEKLLRKMRDKHVSLCYSDQILMTRIVRNIFWVKVNFLARNCS